MKCVIIIGVKCHLWPVLSPIYWFSLLITSQQSLLVLFFINRGVGGGLFVSYISHLLSQSSCVVNQQSWFWLLLFHNCHDLHPHLHPRMPPFLRHGKLPGGHMHTHHALNMHRMPSRIVSGFLILRRRAVYCMRHRTVYKLVWVCRLYLCGGGVVFIFWVDVVIWGFYDFAIIHPL